MARTEKRVWTESAAYGLSRASRRPCEYTVYFPDTLVDRRLLLDSEVVADVSDAERAISQLNQGSPALASLEAVAHLLLRAEAVASSRIEHVEVPARSLAQEELAGRLGIPPNLTARAILGNVEALRFAVDELAARREITLEEILKLHRTLMQATNQPEAGGQIRTVQNWIGGNDYNPCGADYIPPPPEEIPDLLDDLVNYLNGDTDSPVVQAALAHAQFETIHPFADGNGRTGRALIHLILRRRGLAPRYVPPISLVLATRSRDYLRGLNATRYRGAADTPEAYQNLSTWVAIFASATGQACAAAHRFGAQIDELVSSWRAGLGAIRRGSATDLLLRALPSAPLVSIATAMNLIRRSQPQTLAAINRLTEAGVLREITSRKRNRAYEVVGLLDLVTFFERSLASPLGDTREAAPSRPVPPLPAAERPRPSL